MAPRVDASHAAAYLAEYIKAYRAEFARFTAAPPNGAGYPPRAISPYLTFGAITCMIARDGTAIASFGAEPPYDWHVAGGPALMADFEPTRVPEAIQALLQEESLAGQNIGIYRLVPPSGVIPDEVWGGTLPEPTNRASVEVEDSTSVEACELDLELADLIARLTFGAFGPILDIQLPDPSPPTPTVAIDGRVRAYISGQLVRATPEEVDAVQVLARRLGAGEQHRRAQRGRRRAGLPDGRRADRYDADLQTSSRLNARTGRSPNAPPVDRAPGCGARHAVRPCRPGSRSEPPPRKFVAGHVDSPPRSYRS